MKYLVENGGDINKENKDGKTPLFYACKSGNKDLVKYLVENGADINKANKDGKTPLSIAREKKHFEIAKYLAEHGADINRDSLQQQNATLLQQVETYKNVLAEVLEQIIQNNGADLKKFSKCLDVAVEAEAKDLLELLIKYGADPNYLDKHGNSVLMIALKKGYARIAKLILSIYSANAHVLDWLYWYKNQTPVSKAKLALMFFKHYDTLDEDKNSPLVYAILSKEISDSDLLEIVKLLIENKVNVNWSTKGVSVLRIAKILERDERIIKLLENAGAIEFYEGKNAIIRLYDYINILGIKMSNVVFEYDILSGGKYNCNVTVGDRKYIQERKKYDSKIEAKEGAAAFALDGIKNGCDPSMRFEKYLKHPRTQYEAQYDLSDIKFIDEDNGDGTHNCKIDIPETPEHRIINLNLRCRSPEGSRSAIKSYFLKSEAWKDFLK